MSRTYNIAVLPGDGTGPEVVAEGIKVLQVAADKAGFKINLTTFDFGGERYLKTGETLPEGAVDELKKFDAIFLGAIGHPDVKPGILEKEVLLKLRFELDQYINFRPVKLYPGVECPIKGKGPDDIDFLVIRENTEGVYAGSGGFLKKGTPDEIAVQDSINTRKGVERCIRFSFEACKKRNSKGPLKGLTEEEKTAGKIGKLKVAEEYPDIVADYAHVDAITMWFVKNPEWFDVIVTDNMFGDIITDLGAMIQGGMGIAAGGNMNPEGVSMFEPIGGSAPKYKGLNKINPLAAICAAGIMLEHLGEEESGKKIESAAMKVTADHLKSLAAGHMGMTTTEVGDLVAKYVKGS
jgi:3-isopropylmalate dehydrogenase